MNYFVLHLLNIPKHLEEDVTGVCFEYSCNGLSENLQFQQRDLVYDGEVLSHLYHHLMAFFSERPSAELLTRLKNLYPELKFEIKEEEQKDWLEEWKKGFESFQLVGPYWIVPTWLRPPAQCEKPIAIDPGMAFGTGTHATTQMMAFLLYRLALQLQSKHVTLSQLSCLDVGTGTSILAILAEKLGFGEISAIDIDPEARRVARQNVDLNNCKRILVKDEELEELPGHFDVVIANIIDGVLLRLRPELISHLKSGGQILLTGILSERDDLFFDRFMEGTPLRVVQRLEKDEWVGYWCQLESATINKQMTTN